MISNDPKEMACAKAIYAIAAYLQDMTINPNLTIDDRIKTLQWVYKKIPEINKLLIRLKTERIALK